MPILSVIMPVYNGEKFIVKSLTSILNSTLKDIEVIVINDGSTDNTLSIISQYANVDKRVIMCNQNNAGVSTARNVGLHLARGEYFVFVDADDYIDPCMFEKMVALFDNEEVDLVCCGYLMEYIDNQEEFGASKFSCNVSEQKMDKWLGIKYLLIPNNKKSLATMACNKMGKTKLQKEKNVYFNPEIYECEDGVFWFDYICNANMIKMINTPLYHYCIRESSVSQRNKIDEKKLSNLVAWEHIITKCEILSEELACLAKARYQLYVRKMLFNAYCGEDKKNALEKKELLNRYKKELYTTPYLSLKSKILQGIKGIIVKANLGSGLAQIIYNFAMQKKKMGA